MKSLLEHTIQKISPQDVTSRASARARLEQLTMPHWALGRLMDMAVDLAGMSLSLHPVVRKKTIVVFAADHGVAAAGVSKFPQEVTTQMVLNFVNGGAGMNALARLAGAEVVIVDMGVMGDLSECVASGKVHSKRIAAGTQNMAVGPAMSRDEAVCSITAGIEIANELNTTTDLFGTGEMGIGNTTSSSAIVALLSGKSAQEVTGRGTGIEDEQLLHKIEIINKALILNQPNPSDAIDILSKVGGFEIGGIAGLILGAAAHRKPVVVDGFISTAGALIAQALCPEVTDYIIAAHQSVERGHVAAWALLNKEPLLDLSLRLGEGTGAALAMNLVEASVRILTEVATFAEASVSTAEA